MSSCPTRVESHQGGGSPLGRGGVRLGLVLAVFLVGIFARTARAAEFGDLVPLLQEHCVECHGARDPEGGLELETFEGMLRGGESGPAVVAGKAEDSLLVRALEGRWGKTGKNQFMPPGTRRKWTAAEIGRVRDWINAGAPPPVADGVVRELRVPRIEPRIPPRRPIQSLAHDPKSGLLAVARPGIVDLVDAGSRRTVRSLSGFRGTAQAVVFSSDGRFVYVGSGDVTGGEVVQWRVEDGARIRAYGGHSDAVYGVALTSDGRTLASGGYDDAIRLWNTEDGSLRSTVALSQGAIMGLAFRPDGAVLASASFDRTAKIYASPAGSRLETFGQALKELNAVLFLPDGKTLLTGGGDHRIRAYRISPEAREGSNELLATVFAHEGSILRLACSPDGRTIASASEDRTVKLLESGSLKPRLTLGDQPDWPTAITFAGDGILVVGRADGTLVHYETASGKVVPPPRPELSRTHPRGIERGRATRVRLLGQHLDRATVVRVYRGGALIRASQPEEAGEERWVTLFPSERERPDAWELSVGDGDTESAKVKVWVDASPQVEVGAVAATGVVPVGQPMAGPAAVWSTLEGPGTVALIPVAARAGQTLVFDLSAQRLGAKGGYSLTLIDPEGKAVAANERFPDGGDPLIIAAIAKDGTHQIRVSEVTFGGSPDHFFRLNFGELPLVTGMYPLSVESGKEAEVQVFGAHLPNDGILSIPASAPGEVPMPAPADSWRQRRPWTVLATGMPAPKESEPNGDPAHAMVVPVPVCVNGRFLSDRKDRGGDVDLFRFRAARGTAYIIETLAARRGSTADTRMTVLWPDGRPVERVRLQAMRNSAITFRPETSDDTGIRFENWEEMELNDLLWCGGEVMKILRAPQGPDSDTLLYGSEGKRAGFFDTTPMAHYLDEPVYLVRPLAGGESPVPNGLPVFPVNFENDDAAARDIGTDSRIVFTAPADGEFLVRVSESREFGGPAVSYSLMIREAEPGFAATLRGVGATVAAGSGQGFDVRLNRRDGFNGSVRLSVNHLPPGWSVSEPLVVEAGHDSVSGVLWAAPDASQPSDADWDAVTVVAVAEVDGRPVAQGVNNLGRPKLSRDVPRIRVRLSPVADSSSDPAVELAPGGTAKAILEIDRNGFDGVVTFSVDNLPHGVIVENLGLNGITFLPEEKRREISIAAARWVGRMDRPVFAVENQAGRQTSRPVMLRVREPAQRAAGP